MLSQMIIRIDSAKRDKFNNLSKAEGKTTSQVIRELIDNFIKNHDISLYIDDLWERIGKKLTEKGYVQKDVQRFINASRRAKP